MILYHGSYKTVEDPDLQHTREDIDFGAGFYLTPDIDMAKKWACGKKNSFVSVYDVDVNSLDVFTFGLNKQWLDYVEANRIHHGNPRYNDYDLLIGPTADDKLYGTIEDYLEGMITANQAIEYLNIAGFSNQYVFKNEAAIKKACRYIEGFEITGQEKQNIRQKAAEDRANALNKLLQVRKAHVRAQEQLRKTQEEQELSERC